MAFSLFKRKQYADTILCGGNIRTFDPEYPIASCAAVREGILIAVGDESIRDEFEGKDTKVIELDGRWVIPGFIDLYGHPSQGTFAGTFIKLDESMDLDGICSTLQDYAKDHPDDPYFFAFGFESSLFDGFSEEDNTAFRLRLDEICGEVPLVLLSADNLNMRLSTPASDAIRAMAEDEGVPFVNQAYIMNHLVAPDFTGCIPAMMKTAENYARRGFTSVLNTEKSSYFDNIYRDMQMNAYQAGVLKQRYFGSYSISRPARPETVLLEMDRKFTYCQELAPLINSKQLIILSDSMEGGPHCIGPDLMRAYAENCAEKGYHVRFFPQDKGALLIMSDIAGDLAERYRKQCFSIASDLVLTEEELATVASGSELRLAASSQEACVRQTEGQSYGEAATLFYTETAAKALGIAQQAGSLEDGKWADLAVYESDPFEALDAHAFNALRPVLVMMNGDIVWEEGADGAEAWTETMMELFADELSEEE